MILCLLFRVTYLKTQIGEIGEGPPGGFSGPREASAPGAREVGVAKNTITRQDWLMAATSLYDLGHSSLTLWARCRTLASEASGARVAAADLSSGPSSTAPGLLNPLEWQMAQHQDALRVETSVRSLPADHRRLVFARYVRGLTVAEAARQLGVRDADARRTLRKAVEIVARELKFLEIQAKKRRDAALKLRKAQVSLDGIAKNAQDSLKVEKFHPLAARRHPAAPST